MVAKENHQNFLNQEKTGNISKLLKKGNVESGRIKVIYGDPEEVKAKLWCHTAYIERTNLTSRTMNGRLVRKTLSFSKELRFLEASNALEDAIYNFTRTVKTLRVELPNPSKKARWKQRTPAMAAGLTDHIWTVQELLTKLLVPCPPTLNR